MNKWIFIYFLLLGQSVFAESELPIPHTDKYNWAWYKPELLENKLPLCEFIYQDSIEGFFSTNNTDILNIGKNAKLAGLNSLKLSDITDTIDVWRLENNNGPRKHSRKIPKITVNEKIFYLEDYTYPGCGGGCERYQLLVSEKPFPFYRQDDPSFYEPLRKKGPPPGYYSLATDNSHYYVLLKNDNNLSVYQLLADGEWERSCKISHAPKNIIESADDEIQKALTSIKTLKKSVNKLRGGAGWCGSLGTHFRWTDDMHQALLKTLYRPWSVQEYYDPDSEYDDDVNNLEKWALTGLYENSALKEYRETLSETINNLAQFYVSKFNWDIDESLSKAETALTSAISTGIRFYMYEPINNIDEENLRAAILEKKPIEEIRELPIPSNINNKDRYWLGSYTEHFINLAVSYPAALEYILSKKFSPNIENAFGKTPLMYAAQYNQVESAKLLIKHGADVNAVTTWPDDTCYYTLTTANMTPLHYAVRYASAKMIDLLLNHGARTDIKTETNDYPKKNESPLDWFKRYNSSDSNESNPNINEDDVKILEKKLQIKSS